CVNRNLLQPANSHRPPAAVASKIRVEAGNAALRSPGDFDFRAIAFLAMASHFLQVESSVDGEAASSLAVSRIKLMVTAVLSRHAVRTQMPSKRSVISDGLNARPSRSQASATRRI